MPTLQEKKDHIQKILGKKEIHNYLGNNEEILYGERRKEPTLNDLLLWSFNKGYNLVISNIGKIFFNKAGTKEAEGSYREIMLDLTKSLLEQEEKVIDEIFSLLK